MAAARAAVSAAIGAPVWMLTDNELAAEVANALALKAQAEALLLDRLGEADARGLARSRGATSMQAWLRGSHRLGPGEASRLVRTARTLREQLPATGHALAESRVNLGQVEVIAEALKDLSPDVGPELRAEGEQTLINACASLDPIALGRLGRRLEELLDPDGVQARDEAKIRDHEARAFGKRELTFSPDPYGSGGTIRGRYDADGAAIIHAALDALSAPLPETGCGEKDERSPAMRRYDALLEVLRRHLHHPATSSGDGGKAQIRITIPLASLTDRVGYGLLDDGTHISPSLARRLACDAAIIPAVLGGHGQPLDVGRERRLFTGPTRTGIEVRDGGCVWPGCPRPAAGCEVHHLLPWMAGGRTDQVNGGLFCPTHHRIIEEGDWDAFHHRGRIWLRPPERLDPNRAPRINTAHRQLPPRTDWPPGALGQPPP